MKRILLCLVVFGGTSMNWSFAAEPAAPSADEAAVRKADDVYVAAFNKHDAKGVAAAWSPEATSISTAPPAPKWSAERPLRSNSPPFSRNYRR